MPADKTVLNPLLMYLYIYFETIFMLVEIRIRIWSNYRIVRSL